MSRGSTVVLALLLCAPALAQDPADTDVPPPPAAEVTSPEDTPAAPEPAQPPADEVAPTPDEAAPAPDEVTPAPEDAEPKAPEEVESTPDTVLLGSAVGCGIGAAPPFLIAAAGGGITAFAWTVALNSNDGLGACVVALLGTIIGVGIAIVGTLLYGPCSAVGATVGAVTHALLQGRAPWSALLGALPGVALGVLGSVGAAATLVLATDDNVGFPLFGDNAQTVGWALIAVSLVVALAAGPIGIAGAVWLDEGNREPPPETDARTTTRIPELPAPARHAGAMTF